MKKKLLVGDFRTLEEKGSRTRTRWARELRFETKVLEVLELLCSKFQPNRFDGWGVTREESRSKL